jgi:LPS sulfotransferase NodH
MTGHFDAFVLFAEMRTGSNYLEATLNDLPDLHCYGEVFNPSFIGHHKTFELLGFDMARRETDPVALFDDLIAKTDGLPGMRFFHDHDPRVLEHILPNPRVAKVILTRNPVESYVSRKIAAQTGQWRMTDVKHHRTAAIEFDSAEFEEMLDALQSFQLDLQRGLQTTGQSAFFLRYEDINDVDVINGLARFLGSGHQLDATSGKLKKQNPSDLNEKVSNYDEMVAGLAQIDRFDLGRTPSFEPIRHPAVPGYFATPEAGLLFMPIKGAPVEEILDWMAEVEGCPVGALLTKFNQKALRQWMRQHPGYRSFTVLRHPVARAYHAFNTYILPNDVPNYADIRRVLRKMYDLKIPQDGIVDGYGLDEHREAFLQFLSFLKGNLTGQTSIRVDPSWASQTALLQGFSQMTLPDLLIREEELPDTLARLSERVPGVAMAQNLTHPSAPFALAEIYDATIETAVSNIYRRDYLNFGFDRWNKT